jgi:hypothetical protein
MMKMRTKNPPFTTAIANDSQADTSNAAQASAHRKAKGTSVTASSNTLRHVEGSR